MKLTELLPLLDRLDQLRHKSHLEFVYVQELMRAYPALSKALREALMEIEGLEREQEEMARLIEGKS